MTQVMLSMCELKDKGKRPYTEISTLLQGCRRVFKSGPAVETIKCQSHERGSAREGYCSLSRKWGLGVSP